MLRLVEKLWECSGAAVGRQMLLACIRVTRAVQEHGVLDGRVGLVCAEGKISGYTLL